MDWIGRLMLGMSLGVGFLGGVGARLFLRVDSVGMDSVEMEEREMMGWGMSLGRTRFEAR